MTKMSKFAALLCVTALGLNVQAKVMESSVATVDGKSILASEYDNYLEEVTAQYTANAPQVLEQPYAKDMLGKEVLKDLISKELIYQAALKAGIKGDDPDELNKSVNEIKSRFIIDEKTGKEDPKGAEKRFNAALDKQGLKMTTFRKRLSKEIASRKILERELPKLIKPVEEADIKELYDDVQAVLKNKTKKIKTLEKENPARLQEAQAIATRLKQLTAEQVRLGHIYLATTKDMSAADRKKKEELAKKIKKEIDGGMDFAAAVKTYTEDPQAVATGGDMILIKGIAPKEIDAKAFTLSVGKVSDPIKTDVGYHIIKIKEKRAERTIEFDDIKNDLGQYLVQTRVLEAQAKYLSGLAEKADIKITKEFEIDKVIAAEQAKKAAEKEAAKSAGKEPAKAAEKDSTKAAEKETAKTDEKETKTEVKK